MTSATGVATRPRNRKQQIIEAAGPVFSERGYHAASMEEIAGGVGITAAALYRHFPNKYALFAECADSMVTGLAGTLDEVPAEASLAEVLGAVVRVTVERRASGGVYRWLSRYLEDEDRRRVRAKFAQVVEKVTVAVRREHPLPLEGLRTVAALGAIGSVTTHHTSIAQRRLEEVLLSAALRVAAADAVPGGRVRSVDLPARPVPRTRRAEILAAAIPLFARDGFANVTSGQIAKAVGVAPSALYRHYSSKVDILAAACLQAAGILGQAVEQNLHGVTDPHESVHTLAATYVAYSFEYTAMTSVARAEMPGLPPEVRRPLALAQRDHIAVWEQQLRLARPDLDPRRTRVLVHAALGVVVETGRALHWENTPAHRDTVTTLVTAALGL
ncbi:TetR/AcrR family transcriptional regulator [Actinocorallia populi]|uniref:TetR/AcrR family transcriptional regulator n=1 Tax=Actinocorallia populi TaxID=2079200 RepID=UPI000D089DA5|nr:TetR/AcrR family transcriptional regulator [Actinocorallia populi]